MPEDPSVNQTAGYISVNPITKYFFWLFEAKENLVSSMVILLVRMNLFFFILFFANSGVKWSASKSSGNEEPLFRTTGDVALRWPWLFLAIGALC